MKASTCITSQPHRESLCVFVCVCVCVFVCVFASAIHIVSAEDESGEECEKGERARARARFA